MTMRDSEAPRIYRIIRFYQANGKQPRTIRNAVTLAEAQAHCSQADTRGSGWFDGYDYIKGLPKAEGEKIERQYETSNVETCGRMVPTGTGSTVCRRPSGHDGVCS
jgi:hypothetical protein